MNAKKIMIALFLGIIIVLPMATFIMPKKEKSELENRVLTGAPHATADTLLDKTFMKQAEDFMSDQFVFRDKFVAARTRFELMQGNSLINNTFICKNMLLENLQQPDQKLIDANLQGINEFAKKHKGKIETNVMLIPTATEFYADEIPYFAQTFDQTECIKDFYSKAKDVTCIDAYAPLAAGIDDYIFYRTDHHWTSYGAYLGYSALSKALGYKAATKDMFNIEHATYDFLGTHYSNVLYGEQFKDNIDIYHFAKGEVVSDVIKYNGKNKQTYSSILFNENLNTRDKYGVFLGGNDPVVQIKTDINNGKKLIIFKDSYTNSLMQFLPLHYEEIALVDLRYLKQPLENFIDINDYSQALFLYNMSGFVKDATVKNAAQY